jgi:hypothetical protein
LESSQKDRNSVRLSTIQRNRRREVKVSVESFRLGWVVLRPLRKLFQAFFFRLTEIIWIFFKVGEHREVTPGLTGRISIIITVPRKVVSYNIALLL